jgi:hypothetical protein
VEVFDSGSKFNFAVEPKIIAKDRFDNLVMGSVGAASARRKKLEIPKGILHEKHFGSLSTWPGDNGYDDFGAGGKLFDEGFGTPTDFRVGSNLFKGKKPWLGFELLKQFLGWESRFKDFVEMKIVARELIGRRGLSCMDEKLEFMSSGIGELNANIFL